MEPTHRNDFRERNAYLFLHCDRQPIGDELASTAVKDVSESYIRLIHKRGWRIDRLDVCVSWLPNTVSAAFRVCGWEAYGSLSEEPEKHCAPYTRPRGKGSMVEVCVEAYIVPEAAEYEWRPFLQEVREEVFHSFASSGGHSEVPAAVRICHLPTNICADCREVERAATSAAGYYARECDRKAAWSFLLDHLRMTG